MDLAADIGGTFTDMVFLDAQGEVRVEKTPSTPHNFAVGVLEGVRKIGAPLRDLETFVHGATVVLNALLEMKLPVTGLVTTQGFRDVLEIMRTNNPDMYNLHYIKPAPIVPRYLRLEVSERTRHTGEVTVDLEEDDVRRAAEVFLHEGVDAIGVCLLHAYANPSHELRVKEILEGDIPGVVVSLSSDVAPEWREFERTATTTLNAASIPIITSYLNGLADELQGSGLRKDLLVMQSSGGVMTARAACSRPVATVMSGPSGGVVGALRLAEQIGLPNVITADIGGTSSDMGVIANGHAVSVTESTFNNWPILAPTIEILSIGAGGGSIAWVDSGGALRVGPQSAGAKPGPVCYGRGGSEPTVTDANLVLGRIDADYFLGGEMTLEVDDARQVLKRKIGEPTGLSATEAADGIVRIVNSNMAKAMRSILVERGFDPREFVVMAFGGAGGLHTGELMEELGIPRAIVPNNPGALSALGMLAADFRHDRARTNVTPLALLDPDEGTAILHQLGAQALEHVMDQGVEASMCEVKHSVDLRYTGQEYHLTIPLDLGADLAIDALGSKFNQAHQRTYGYATPEFSAEVVNFRATAIGRKERPNLPRFEARRGAPLQPDTTRSVYLAQIGFCDAAIYRIETLKAGDRIEGPAVIEDPRSTILILPEHVASIDELRNVRLERA